MSGEDSDRGFTVVDKRHSSDGAEAPGAEAAAGPETASAASEPSGGALPPTDFTTFVMSLSTSALMHMGLVAERPGAEPPAPNLPLARQTVDILEMIQEKTRGNLSAEEDHLLQSLLTELRMRYVESSRR